jgi:hypothetical protein
MQRLRPAPTRARADARRERAAAEPPPPAPLPTPAPAFALQVFELAAAGANVMQIADRLEKRLDEVIPALEYGTDLVQRHSATRPADVQQMECARIDRLRMALWPRCMKGEDAAIRTYLLLMDQRAKYTAGVYVDRKMTISARDGDGRNVGSFTISGAEPAGILKQLESLSTADSTRERVLAELDGIRREVDDDVDILDLVPEVVAT